MPRRSTPARRSAAGEPATVKEGFEELMAFTDYKSNAALGSAIYEQSASTIDWLENYGFETRLAENTHFASAVRSAL